MKRPSQKDIILNHLRKYGSINSLEAIRRYGITRISAVIYNIRNSGIPISATPDNDMAPMFVTYRIDHKALKRVEFEKIVREVNTLSGKASDHNMKPEVFSQLLTDAAIRANRLVNTTIY